MDSKWPELHPHAFHSMTCFYQFHQQRIDQMTCHLTGRLEKLSEV